MNSVQKAQAYLEPKQTSLMELCFEYTERLTIFVIKGARLSYIYAENIEIFEVKLRWSKSSRLLQRVAFLVSIFFSFRLLILKYFVIRATAKISQADTRKLETVK